MTSPRPNAFRDVFRVLEHRIRIFTALPDASLDKARLQEIGQSMPGA